MNLIFTSSKIKVPVYSTGANSGLIDHYDSNYSINFKIKINDSCNSGFEHKKYEIILDLCLEC